jgi:bacterial/archaeal transporter family protein
MKQVHKSRTHCLVFAFVGTNVLGNVALSRGLHHSGVTVPASAFDHIRIASPWTITGICLLAAWVAFDLALLSRADLSYILPVTASSNVLIALAGHFWLHEHISVARGIGILMISSAVLLAETTPDRTTKRTRDSFR